MLLLEEGCFTTDLYVDSFDFHVSGILVLSFPSTIPYE